MNAVWEHIDASLLGAGIIDTNFWVWHTTAVARLWIRLILNLPITLEWTCKMDKNAR